MSKNELEGAIREFHEDTPHRFQVSLTMSRGTQPRNSTTRPLYRLDDLPREEGRRLCHGRHPASMNFVGEIVSRHRQDASSSARKCSSRNRSVFDHASRVSFGRKLSPLGLAKAWVAPS